MEMKNKKQEQLSSFFRLGFFFHFMLAFFVPPFCKRCATVEFNFDQIREIRRREEHAVRKAGELGNAQQQTEVDHSNDWILMKLGSRSEKKLFARSNVNRLVEQ